MPILTTLPKIVTTAISEHCAKDATTDTMPSTEPKQERSRGMIKVEDAISNLKNQMLRFAEGTEPDLALQMAIKALEECKPGKWISDSAYHITVSLDESGKVSCSCHCSLCGDWLTGSDEYACRGNYCPNCGAKMEGEE